MTNLRHHVTNMHIIFNVFNNSYLNIKIFDIDRDQFKYYTIYLISKIKHFFISIRTY